MMRFLPHLSLLAISCLFSIQAHAAVLTLEESMQIALADHPLLATQQAILEANRQNAVAEAQLPDPMLKLGVSNIPTDSFSLSRDAMTQRMISIEQRIPGGDKLQLKGRVGELSASRSETELDGLRRSVRRNTGLAWLEVYYVQQAKRMLLEQQHEFRNQVDAMLIDYRVGKISQEEVLKSHTMLNQLLDRDTELKARMLRARAELARWIGTAAQRDIPAAIEIPQREPRLDKLQGQLADHPEMRGLALTVTQAETELALAQESYKPDWGMELGYANRAAPYTDMVSAQVALNLPLFPDKRQDRTVAAKRAMLESVRYQREDRLRSLSTELAIAHADWASAASRLALLETQTIPRAKQNIAAAINSYKASKRGISGVLEAHHVELEARLQYLEQQVELLRARVRLAYFGDIEGQ